MSPETQPESALKHIFTVWHDQGMWIIEIDPDKPNCGFAVGPTLNAALDNAKEVLTCMNGILN